MTARLANPKPTGARGVMNRERAAQIAAARLGLSTADYLTRREAGLKWCYACREWHPESAFNIDRYQPDGFQKTCRPEQAKRHARWRRRYRVVLRV